MSDCVQMDGSCREAPGEFACFSARVAMATEGHSISVRPVYTETRGLVSKSLALYK